MATLRHSYVWGASPKSPVAQSGSTLGSSPSTIVSPSVVASSLASPGSSQASVCNFQLSTYVASDPTEALTHEGRASNRSPSQPRAMSFTQGTLHRELRALKPPPSILQALSTSSDARERLTLQLYYGVPAFFTAHNDVATKDHSQIQKLQGAQLAAAAKYLAMNPSPHTMRAALVLLDNEIAATSTVLTWLAATNSTQHPLHHGLLQGFHREILHIREARAIVHLALAPKEINGSPLCLLMNRADQSMSHAEADLCTEQTATSRVLADRPLRCDANLLSRVLEAQVQAPLLCSAKDLAAAKVMIESLRVWRPTRG
ncbi:hypothetical protein LTR62_008006 [Meristemomyces frigidus]|uniref:Uncharacterized protein n=1 Tax=Meristemomyces frigidus TaxID=1508187 RepID=A0AAN7YT33_9PEZI|nr:hypothetical protein LTR62_008006 [Meristemomyces frigidus]